EVDLSMNEYDSSASDINIENKTTELKTILEKIRDLFIDSVPAQIGLFVTFRIHRIQNPPTKYII
ncbi:10623_t:CDS:2, partial [Scutellospora calospora]